MNYRARSTAASTVIKTDSGSMVVENGVFEIRSGGGVVLAGAELSFRVYKFVFPIAATIKDHTATLTPQFDLKHATYRGP